MAAPLNRQLAMKLQEMADLLEQQGANPFRAQAYRHAAVTLSGLAEDISLLLEREGMAGLLALPDIGKGIANALAEMITTGHWGQLQRLRGTLDPEPLFQTLPGVGPGLAKRIHDELHIDTLEALENAAYDGTLLKVEGIGSRRLLALQAALSTMLGRTGRPVTASQDVMPPVALLLAVDRLYREQAGAGKLPLIAPRRFNPEGVAWLPVLHLEQEGWHFTAIYSNTARAHQLKRTHDWVVIYFYDDHHQEGQQTLVTETHGPLAGRRVVRGHEVESGEYYR